MAARPGRVPLPTANPNAPVQFTSGRTGPQPPPSSLEASDPAASSPTPATPPAEVVEAPPDEQSSAPSIADDRLPGLAALDELLTNDPNLRDIVARYMTGQPIVPPQTYAPPQPQSFQPQLPYSEGQPSPVAVPQGGGTVGPSVPAPQFLQAPPDLADDPSLAALYANQQRIEQALTALLTNQQTMAQQQAATQQADFAAITNAAVGKFKSDMELDDGQISRIVNTANQLGILDSFLHGIDPITNTPTPPDPHGAVMRTLEVAYSVMPEFQPREFERRQRQYVEDQARKAKLSAVGGGGPQAPRSAPAPTTPQERQAALHDEVAQMLAGNWAPPNAQ